MVVPKKNLMTIETI